MTPPFTALLAELAAGLSGDRDRDAALLLAACERHGDEPWAPDFARAVFALMIERGLVSPQVVDGLREAEDEAHDALHRAVVIEQFATARGAEGAETVSEAGHGEPSAGPAEPSVGPAEPCAGPAEPSAGPAELSAGPAWDALRRLQDGPIPLDGVVHGLGAGLMAAASEQGLPLRRDVAWGVLPLRSVDALALRAADCGLAVLSVGHLVFCHRVAEAVASFVPPKRGDEGSFSLAWFDVERRLDTHAAGHDRFVDAFVHAARGDVLAAPHNERDASFKLAGVLRRNAQRFALAGVLAAAALDPPLTREFEPFFFADGTVADARSLPADSSIERLKLDPRAQVSADVVALRLALGASLDEGRDLALSFAGIDLYLGALGLLEVLRHERPAFGGRHRRQAVRDALRHHGPAETEDALALADALHRILVGLLERNGARLEANN